MTATFNLKSIHTNILHGLRKSSTPAGETSTKTILTERILSQTPWL